MFDQISESLHQVFRSLKGENRFTEKNIAPALEKIERALSQADVAREVISQLLETIKKETLGQDVLQGVKPEQALVNIIHQAIMRCLSNTKTQLAIHGRKPAIILMAGLQGSGKTTSTVKLGRWIQHETKQKVMVSSVDIYRPAAIEQLEIMAEKAQLLFHPSTIEEKPIDIAKKAIAAANAQTCDVLIIDTAGRLHIDASMMTELKSLHHFLQPQETLFVVDAMTGQDAARTAKSFHAQLALSGVILSKIDSDSRGGAALSVQQITGKPIKFMGSGEGIDDFDEFDAERITSQILGMGDIVALVKKAERHVDQKQASKINKKIQKGSFNLQDYREQIKQLMDMGGMQAILSKMPNMGKMGKIMDQMGQNDQFMVHCYLIDSMTPQERNFPDLLKQSSRKRRIALGSGRNANDINQLLKHFTKMKKNFAQIQSSKFQKLLQRFQKEQGSGDAPFT
jgi:signal recognition particle subunit SRP54